MLVNRSFMLTDLIGAEILLAFWVKGQVLHHQRVHLKDPDWLMDFSELLTRKLRWLLSVFKKKVVEVKKFGCIVSGSFRFEVWRF